MGQAVGYISQTPPTRICIIFPPPPLFFLPSKIFNKDSHLYFFFSYILEKSLSVTNLFVFVLIFQILLSSSSLSSDLSTFVLKGRVLSYVMILLRAATLQVCIFSFYFTLQLPFFSLLYLDVDKYLCFLEF